MSRTALGFELSQIASSLSKRSGGGKDAYKTDNKLEWGLKYLIPEQSSDDKINA